MTVIETGTLDQLKKLLSENVDREKWGEYLLEAAENGFEEKVKLLLEYDAPVDCCMDGNNCVNLACSNGNLAIVKQLVEKGASITEKGDLGGNFALLFAAEIGSLDIIKYLLEIGAPVSAINDEGDNALMLAVYYGHLNCVKFLVTLLDLLYTNKAGDTAIILATSNSQTEMVEWLLENSEIDINATNEDGDTALMLAIEEGDDDIVEALEKKGAQ